ncbi:MAG: hypothetical protein V1866_06350 [archaeon]
MPIYNDNRQLLGDSNHRRLVTMAFQELIWENDIEFDMVLGTSTAGIAPAVSVANRNNVPLLIIQNRRPYVFSQPISTSPAIGSDIIVSTCPWAIPCGVTTANALGLPFAYVRQSEKEYGMMQQIEGIVKEGQRATLFGHHMGDSYLDVARNALAQKGVTMVTSVSSDLSSSMSPPDIKGARVLVIEDLISTGGSSAEEVDNVRWLGGKVSNCISIFNYELDKAEKAFAALKPACRVLSCLTYGKLLEVAERTGYLNQSQIASLTEWRAGPFGWGEKRGFPRVEKK